MSETPAATIDPDEFPHGVASFDPTDTSVLLWSRLAGARQARWYLRPLDEAGPATRSGELRADDPWGVVTVDVDGLEPGRQYLYWFSTDVEGRQVESRVGRTRTLPAGSPGSWRLGALCCADYSINHLTVHRHLAEAEVDLVLHLGDYIYETDGKGERDMDPDGVCVTLEDYDRRYAQVRQDPDTLDLHARHPMVCIWDDHDVADNAWRHGAKAHDPDEHGAWEPRLQAAATARQRWLPARLDDPGDTLRLWRSVRVGDLVEVVVMDTRIDGRDQQAGDPGAPPLRAEDRAIVGPAQRRWIEERIRDRTQRWCVLATQVTMHPMRLPVAEGVEVLDGAPSGYAVVDGDVVCVDEWDGYPAERGRLARWLADRGGDALVLSGDVHSSWVFEGDHSPGIRAVAPEFVVPAVSSTPMARQLPKGWQALADQLVDARMPGPRWFELASWGYVVLTVTPGAVTGSWYRVDASRADGDQELMATWALTSGAPGELRSYTASD